MSNKMTHLTLPGDVEREIVDADARENLVAVQTTQPTSETTKLWINSSSSEEIQIPTWEEFQQKSNKTRIDFDGTNFKIGEKVLTYKELHDVHLIQPDFAFVVYGDRAYLLSYVQDDTNAMREMRFQSVIAVTASDNTSNVKVSGIYVKSSDGVNFAGTPTIVDVNSENKAYKATEINDSNKNSNVWYPSVKAVADKIANKVNIADYEKLAEMTLEQAAQAVAVRFSAKRGFAVVEIAAANAATSGYVRIYRKGDNGTNYYIANARTGGKNYLYCKFDYSSDDKTEMCWYGSSDAVTAYCSAFTPSVQQSFAETDHCQGLYLYAYSGDNKYQAGTKVVVYGERWEG